MLEAVELIHDFLREDETLEERTTLLPNRIIELLESCLKSTYFSCMENFYDKNKISCYGLCHSGQFIYGIFEELALESATTRHVLWKRYVLGDTIRILKEWTARRCFEVKSKLCPCSNYAPTHRHHSWGKRCCQKTRWPQGE